MGSSPGSTALELGLESLRVEAEKYSFFQLSQLVERCVDANEDYLDASGQSKTIKLRYCGRKSLSFPASDVCELVVVNSPGGIQVEMEVAFMGLFGPASPLPVFYTEQIIQSDDEWEVVGDFLDLINHHLISKLRDCWKKYRYYTQFKDDGCDALTLHAFRLGGIQDIAMLERLNLEWQRILPLINFFAMKVKNSEGLKSVIEGYFDQLTVRVEECFEREVSIPRDQLHQMGLSNSSLNLDLVLGETIFDRMGKVRIHIVNLDSTNFSDLLPDTETYDRLRNLVSLYFRDQFEFDISLEAKGGVGNYFISSIGEGNLRMGWNSCLGEPAKFDDMNIVL